VLTQAVGKSVSGSDSQEDSQGVTQDQQQICELLPSPRPDLPHELAPLGVPVFPRTGKLICGKGFQRLQPVLETLDFAIGAIRKWQSLTHGPEDRVTGEQPEIRAVRQRIGAVWVFP
jgi:hypothetical protein